MTTSKNEQPTAQALYDACRKRRRGNRHRRSQHEGEITYLNITPMLDMMTILLVFLIKSFSASAADVNVANLTLPHSSTQLEIEEAIQLMLPADEILVDQRLVTRLDKGQLRGDDLPEGPNGYLIKPLYDVLESRASYFKKIEANGGAQFAGAIAVIADRGINYKTVFKVLYTAGRAEFGYFKLFVQKPPG